MLVATWWRWAALVLCAVVGVSLAGETWDEPAGDVTVATSGGLSPEWTGRRYERGHLWAFYPVTRPQVPQAAGHPIDAFIEDRLAAAGLEPAPPADRRALIRRATLGLTGLPPMVREIEVFLADTSPDAFERVIERLLSSPQYGQRMAQHWLDVTRYADTAGLSNDHDRPNAWRYRDYVVRAFNTDKPYDRFVLEQVAGDEIDDQEPELLIAAGFLRMGPWEHTAMSVAAETRQQYLDDVTHAVGETFLGVGLQCAKCHDHKFDPIPTRDYYQMQAVFAPVQFADRPAAFAGWENTAAFKEGRARVERLLEEARAGLREIREKEDRAIVAWLVDRGMEITVAQAKKWPEDQRPPRHLGLSNEDLGVAKVWQKRQELLQRQMMRYEPLAMSIYNGPPRIRLSGAPHPMPAKRSGEAQPVHILLGGSLQSPGETVGPGALSGAENLSGLSAQIPQTLDGRRLALAAWITDPRNPLTARVMVNRIWQWHFGRGLAANPNNFGKMGAKPTHPQLLNWLADEFIRSGWSVKHIHKLIMTSQVYQRSTRHPRMDAVREADAANAMLSFFPPRRLTAEELRDAMLTASGELNLEIGGPPVYPEINREVALQPRHIMGSVAPAYQPSAAPAQRHRRTLYAVRVRQRPDPMLEVFDRPGPDVSCERRDSSTVAPQAFSLLNSPQSHDRALAMSRRLEMQATTFESRIEQAFRLALGRAPSKHEAAAAMDHVKRMTAHHRAHPPQRVDPPLFVTREMVEEMTGLTFTWDERLDVYADWTADLKPWDVAAETRALADLCLVLFNSNEFAYVY